MYILIGMPGCGKSCMGKYIASKLKIKHIDSDRLIEERCGKKLHEIIAEKGLEGFKQIEKDVLMSIEPENVIISTGGSAVYYEEAMERFRNIGTVIYLYVGLEEIKRRLGDFSKRGIVLAEGQTIADLFKERTRLYEKYADVTVNCNGRAYQEYQAELIRILKDIGDK